MANTVIETPSVPGKTEVLAAWSLIVCSIAALLVFVWMATSLAMSYVYTGRTGGDILRGGDEGQPRRASTLLAAIRLCRRLATAVRDSPRRVVRVGDHPAGQQLSGTDVLWQPRFSERPMMSMFRRSFLFGLLSLTWSWITFRKSPLIQVAPAEKPPEPRHVFAVVLGGSIPTQWSLRITPIDRTIAMNRELARQMNVTLYHMQRPARTMPSEFGVSNQILVGTAEEIADHFLQQIRTAALEAQWMHTRMDLPSLTQDTLDSVGYVPGKAVTVPFTRTQKATDVPSSPSP